MIDPVTKPDPQWIREEDNRLVAGRGRYNDDLHFDNEAHMAFVRAPFASARITGIDCAAAREMPGVLAIVTGRDVREAGFGTISTIAPVKRADGSPLFHPPYAMICEERTRFVGDIVAAVVAETALQAEEAREAILVDYEDLAAVTDVAEAVRDGAPAVWDEVADNVAYVHRVGDMEAADAAFARAAFTVEADLRISRLVASPIEPRSAIALHDADADRFTLHVGVQNTHAVRDYTAGLMNIAPDRLRLVTHDVGGSFGMKNAPLPEYVLVLWLAKRLGRPVRWLSSRNEAFQGDPHARDQVSHAALALDADGRFLAVKVRTLANQGAYFNRNTPTSAIGNVGGLAGVYRTPTIAVEVFGIHTHTQPTTPYRGAGRPEATYIIERLIDLAAQKTGIDRVSLRRRNMIAPDEMPFRTGLTYTYDCGDFPAVLDSALEAADWAGFDARKAQSAANGLLRGIGIANPVEIAGGPFGKPFSEFAEIRFDETGKAMVLIGGQDVGQGTRSTFAQMTHDFLGLDRDRLEVVTGDTDAVARGTGTFGSRTMGSGGTALFRAAEEVKRRALAKAADHLEAAPGDITFEAGEFRIAGTDRAVALHALAAADPSGLSADAWEAPENATFPNGCHVAEVEIDPETGRTEVVAYTVVDDVGTVVNPALVKGQIHGGVAQGYAQAVGEAVVFEEGTGQLVTGSFMDYRMPRADDLPMIEVITHAVPTKVNPLGVKGAGEAGTVGALPCIVSAIMDALAACGIAHIDMPVTPERIWQAIRDARGPSGG
ncbi:carbon-monoxide dehydrogenase large subunit [Breoghania corrubedonensis]|uniref:Carbon-monoxide dehydrogenase large subunit n=1 Tax=Breoghania corrubedonensis TaxID=665038 RepID=A0A2T5VAY3_9HYPH|nr:xanthine dehydrogenase family protein molybdopterin-binding subunit [Breoghania corrubedonensis]PTW60908.1 carbon-monoxide dehydrogenase large subunit [Breoghania corrubedonensis]